MEVRWETSLKAPYTQTLVGEVFWQMRLLLVTQRNISHIAQTENQ